MSEQTSDARLASLMGRDASADGTFVYGVATTGVYCRPSCPSRRPKPENLRFFDDCDAAEAAGFRACRRCAPRAAAPGAELIAKLRRAIDEAETPPTLADLSRLAKLSPTHLQRVFRRATGLSPHAYARGIRAARLREALHAPDTTVTAAIYEAGFGSGAAYYDQATGLLGMNARQVRNGGAGAAIRFAIAASSLGAVLVAASERGVCNVSLGDDPDALARDLQDRFPHAELSAGDAAFDRLVAEVVTAIDRPGEPGPARLDLDGTMFQLRVWEELRRIPAGSTATYTQIAERIGRPTSVRAVANACGSNNVAVLVPCHRIVRRDGTLSGYRWGVERKRALLDREASLEREADATAGDPSP